VGHHPPVTPPGCHGSAFDPADGSVLQGPASVPLVPVEVAVAGGEVRLG
jgi:Rieske Fe-S protein